jgi:hypothetical protein
MTVEVESEREAFGVLGGILAGFVGKLAVGGTGGGNGSGGERQEGMQLEESMEEKLMRVFIRHLINENIKLSETNTQKH